LFCIQLYFGNIIQGQGINDEILSRADSWFGIHFDLHASEDLENVGETLTEEMITGFLTRVQPDYIQVDCKGHSGISSYPTKEGFHVKSFDKDPMALFRKVTHAHDVGLYVHFSGIYDRKVTSVHPDYAVVNPDGSRDDQMTSMFGPYVDEYLIPQLKELSRKYEVDGAWIDGECWAVKPDYSEKALNLFRNETGISSIPYSPDDENYHLFMDFQRKYFENYIDHYMNELHEYDPTFQVTSNWAYSSMMPVEPKADLDYLSGDLQPFNAVYSAAFEARCLASQGKPWDLMAWSFNWSPVRKDIQRSTKPAFQLMQEAAGVMALGGGMQFYFRQNKDLSIQPWTVNIMEELAGFVRARQPWCENAIPVKEIGLLYSGESFLRSLNTMYAPGWDAPQLNGLKGMLNALLDNHYQVDILMEHHLDERINDYQLLIVPEWDYLSEEVVHILVQFAQKGGNLMLVGTGTLPLFKNQLGINRVKVTGKQHVYLKGDSGLADINDSRLLVELSPEFKKKGYFYSTNDLRYKTNEPVAAIRNTGKGKITTIFFNAGSVYEAGSNPVIRNFIGNRVMDHVALPHVKVSGSNKVQAVVAEKNNKKFVNIINMSGNHSNVNVFGLDIIPPVYDVEVYFRYQNLAEKIVLQPGNQLLDFDREGDYYKVSLPGVHIHSIIEIIE
ncbi:MAG: alpha-amylase family protein, partial [Bacteroidales bacterium]